MESLLISLLVIFAGIVLIPPLARRLGLPVIVVELIYGIILGVSLLDLVHYDEPTLEFFASFGLVYLMFVVGLEVDFGAIYREGDLRKVIAVAVASLLIPFAAGAGVSYVTGVHPLLLGTIFCTTSIGLILPLLKDIPSSRRFSQTLIGSVAFVDVVSIFILAFVLAIITNSVGAKFIYGLLVMVVLLLLPWLLGRKIIRNRIETKIAEEAHFDIEVRISFALIFLLAATSSILGFHAIIGAFIAGLVVSEVIPKHAQVEQKLQSFGYGFFIPLFFILVGTKVNLPELFSSARDIVILVLIVIVALLSKVVGVSVATKLIGFRSRESLAFGIFHGARLSLIIAAAEVSRDLDLIGDSLFASLVILAIASAIVAPAMGKRILSRA
jgi:Kef-type K+ transport system membrane component KefB